MKIKQVQRILMTNFLFVLLVGFLLVLLYETEILEPTNLAGDVTLVYVITVAMEFLTIAVIPFALKLFSFKAIHRQLINTFMYYQTMAPAFGYMAIILFLCLFFVYPSVGRCEDETTEAEG